MPGIAQLVDDLERSYKESQERMSDPAVYNDHREAAEVGRRLKELEEPYRLSQDWRAASADLVEARSDGDLRELVPELEERVRDLEEELIAAAHASCFSMALSHGLAEAGNPPDRLNVKATSTFVPGTGITEMKLDVTGRVPGMDDSAFQEAARVAAETCPVSQALKGNVDISVDARLES